MKKENYNKELLIKKFLDQPIKIGDSVTTKGLGLQSNDKWGRDYDVVSFSEDGHPQINMYGHGLTTLNGEIRRSTYDIGYNPIKSTLRVDTLNYSIESLMNVIYKARFYNVIDGTNNIETKFEEHFGSKVYESNFNPFVIIDGEKKYYQRDFVWTIEQCQNLIESIYNNIDCGRVLVRERSWKWIETMCKNGEDDLGFFDIVDGKQRLTALFKFFNNEYPDKDGFYFSDFSENAQHQFMNKYCISFGKLHEKTTDIEVLEQFLITNFAGVPQSTEHLDYVRSILSINK